jgi:hypothetical protein
VSRRDSDSGAAGSPPEATTKGLPARSLVLVRTGERPRLRPLPWGGVAGGLPPSSRRARSAPRKARGTFFVVQLQVVLGTPAEALPWPSEGRGGKSPPRTSLWRLCMTIAVIWQEDGFQWCR